MSRNPRSTTPCRPPPSGATATIGGGPCPRPGRAPKPVPKSTIPKRGPPPAPPKKVDYKKPTMTKAMQQRLKHAQKFQEEMERKERERREASQCRRPKRTAAPVGGDARMGRERRPGTAEQGGRCRPASARQQAPCPPAAAEPPPPCPAPAAQAPCPRQKAPCPSRSSSAPVPARTRNLAKSMNADIVQAEPLEKGPIDNLIIPPGAINAEKTTIVSIPQPAESTQIASSTIAPANTSQLNKSAQVIAETLDEQDATEAAIVNSKLQDLQQARRDFVMAVANVGTNAVNLSDESFPNLDVTPITDITPPMMMSPESPGPTLMPCLELDDPSLQIQYGRYHPIVESAREYMRSRQTERRMDEDFQRVARQPIMEDLMEEDLLGGECPRGLPPGLMDDDDDGGVCEPAHQYHGTMIPRVNEPYYYPPYQEDRLEKFFDLERYPNPAASPPRGPPPGRECLPPDLWEIEDPWYREPPGRDLIDFGNC